MTTNRVTHRREVVISGVGVVTAHGIGRERFWEGLHKQVADERIRVVEGFDLTDWGLQGKHVRRTDRFTQFSLAAAIEAVADAGLATLDGSSRLLDGPRVGVSVGTGFAGAATWQEQTAVALDRGRDFVAALTVPKMRLWQDFRDGVTYGHRSAIVSTV